MSMETVFWFEALAKVAMVLLLAREVLAIKTALLATEKVAFASKYNVLKCTYLWKSDIFGDIWRSLNNVKNIPIRTNSTKFSILMLGFLWAFEVGTPLSAFGMSAGTCVVVYTVSVAYCVLSKSATYIEAKAAQDLLESKGRTARPT